MTKEIKIRGISIGNGQPVAVQSMTNLPITDINATAEQIRRLIRAKCDIVRIAVPDMPSAEAFGKVRALFDIPLVADIHFDWRLAVAAVENGADKIRINPGNIAEKDLINVMDAAKAHGIPIRIGVNGGSVNKKSLAECGGDKTRALVKSLSDYVSFFVSHGFDNLVLSAKSSDVKETVAVNRAVSRLGFPLHIGVTEAGPYNSGLIKNAAAIGSLLSDGIGDTVRVSLTDDPVNEVIAAREILAALGLSGGVSFVSCPKCGRCRIDLEQAAKEIYDYVKDINKKLKIAVMGCEVNGVGECSDADLGMAGGKGKYAFFRHGKVFRTVDEADAVTEFKKEIDALTK